MSRKGDNESEINQLELVEKRDELLETRDKLEEELKDLKQQIADGKSSMGRHDDSMGSIMMRRQAMGKELKAVQESLNEIESDIDPEILAEALDVEKFVETTQDLQSILNGMASDYEVVENEINSLQENRQNAEKLVNSLIDLEATARGLLEESTSSALGSQFSDRKTEIEDNLMYWKWASIASIAFLILSSSVIYYDLSTNPTSLTSTFSKLALIIPISVAVWFTVSNYNRGKYLMEEYEFKARMALSMIGFREVLREELSEDDSELLAEAIIETIDKLYANPQAGLNKDNERKSEVPLVQGQFPIVELIQRSR